MTIEIIEKLINEHESIENLKEQLLLLKDQIVAYENELCAYRIKTSALANLICNLESEIQNLKLENGALNEKIQSFHSRNPQVYRCRYCSSTKLISTGGAPHRIFGDMGIVDASFTCLDCDKESVITLDALK